MVAAVAATIGHVDGPWPMEAAAAAVTDAHTGARDLGAQASPHTHAQKRGRGGAETRPRPGPRRQGRDVGQGPISTLSKVLKCSKLSHAAARIAITWTFSARP